MIIFTQTHKLEFKPKENYHEILRNLNDCLNPSNQLERLLVEKIAVDFWRLGRTIRFETGSIVKGIQSLLKEVYLHGNKSNEEIHLKENLLEWNSTYIECLSKGEVSFDQSEWKGEIISSDIVDDFYMIAKKIARLILKWLCFGKKHHFTFR